jgi:hypothetical protein
VAVAVAVAVECQPVLPTCTSSLPSLRPLQDWHQQGALAGHWEGALGRTKGALRMKGATKRAYIRMKGACPPPSHRRG